MIYALPLPRPSGRCYDMQMADIATRYVLVDGLALRAARLAAGHSQSQLGARVGISQPVVSEMESRRVSKVDRGLLRDLARALRVAQRELIGQDTTAA